MRDDIGYLFTAERLGIKEIALLDMWGDEIEGAGYHRATPILFYGRLDHKGKPLIYNNEALCFGKPERDNGWLEPRYARVIPLEDSPFTFGSKIHINQHGRIHIMQGIEPCFSRGSLNIIVD